MFIFLLWIHYRFLVLLDFTNSVEEISIIASSAAHSIILLMSMLLLEAAVMNKKMALRFFDVLCVGVTLWFYVDLLVYRILSVHLPKAIRFVFDTGFDQAFLVLRSSGLIEYRDAWKLGGGGVSFAFVALALRWLTRKLSYRFGVHWRPSFCCFAIALAGGAILINDLCWKMFGRKDIWLEQRKVMPMNITFFDPPIGICSFSSRLRPMRDRRAVDASLANLTADSAPKPDIFFFVIESLREDMIDPSTAPNLSRFREDCLAFEKTVASANLTHLSWYSIFSANHALHQHMAQERKDQWGAVPLEIFKRLGYETFVYSGSRLDYRGSDRIIFGSRLQFATRFVDARSREDLDRPEMDKPATDELIRQLKAGDDAGSRLFLVFYESTHHDYYWDPNHSPPFQPYAESWDFSKWTLSTSELAPIRNRYRNSVHFVDSLIGQVLNMLRRSAQYDNAIVVVTGDHGEEFLEFGHMTHGTHLNYIQTTVPIYIKLPSTSELSRRKHANIISHVDILPTLLQVVGLQNSTQNLFDGESVWKKRNSFALVAGGNGGLDPYQFYLDNGYRKVFFQYRSDTVRINLEDAFFLYDVTDHTDRSLLGELSAREAKLVVKREFGDALRRVFSRIDF
jgi:uncharacterized protein